MELLFKNRKEEDQAFIKLVCNDILRNDKNHTCKSDVFAGIFVEGRNREINNLEDFASFHSFYVFSVFSILYFIK